MSTGVLIAVMVIIAVAMFGRSAFGFGHGAFSMATLALMIDVRTAPPLVTAISLLVSIWFLARDWRSIHLKSTAALTLGAMPGIPLGVAVLVLVNQRFLIVVLGGVLAVLAVRRLLGVQLPRLANDRPAVFVGFGAGVLGGAFNLSGMPVAIYGSMRGWTPAAFRTSMTGFLLVTGVVSVVGYAVAGLLDRPLIGLVLLCIIPAFLGDAAGNLAHARMSREVFERSIWIVILATSLLLIGKQLIA